MLGSNLKAGVIRLQIRTLASAHRVSFIGNIFGSKQAKQREEIIKQQDDFEVDAESKIVILNKSNSPEVKPFNPDTDLEGFEVLQWKNNVTRSKDIQKKYNSEVLKEVVSATYADLTGKVPEAFGECSLSDLSFRFKYGKALQSNLGFDISDFIMSKAHNLDILVHELETIISTRWTNERNPNAIAVRPEDFTAKNIYLNQELSSTQQKKRFNQILSKARESAAQ